MDGFELKCLKCGAIHIYNDNLDVKKDLTVDIIVDFAGSMSIECDCGNEVTE